MGRFLPAVHRHREQGASWLRSVVRTSNSTIADSLAGTPEGKRSFGNQFTTIAAVAATLAFTGFGSGFGIVAAATGLLAVLLFNKSIEQEQAEATARDLVEWGRESIAFRRAVGAIWERLAGGPFNTFTSAAEKAPDAPKPHRTQTLADVVKDAGWPDVPGRTAAILEAYLREFLPPSGHEPIMRYPTGVFRSNRGDLISEFEVVKDILTIWHIALEVGGSRAPALREVIRGLHENHVESLRLIWYLAVAHTDYRAVVMRPDYSFMSRIRDVMVGDGGRLDYRPTRRPAE